MVAPEVSRIGCRLIDIGLRWLELSFQLNQKNAVSDEQDYVWSPRLPNAISLANTVSNDFYLRECRRLKILPHPARMPPGLAAFFIDFLTEPGDLVCDVFAGSNTTGFAAQLLGRKWVSFEKDKQFLRQCQIRLRHPVLKEQSRKRASAK
jgi:DNA modification methylase